MADETKNPSINTAMSSVEANARMMHNQMLQEQRIRAASIADRLLDAPKTNRLPAEERYERDPVFRRIVDMLYMMIRGYDYTPTELREAAMLAATMYEMRHVRPILVGRNDIRFGIDLDKVKA